MQSSCLLVPVCAQLTEEDVDPAAHCRFDEWHERAKWKAVLNCLRRRCTGHAKRLCPPAAPCWRRAAASWRHIHKETSVERAAALGRRRGGTARLALLASRSCHCRFEPGGRARRRRSHRGPEILGGGRRGRVSFCPRSAHRELPQVVAAVKRLAVVLAADNRMMLPLA